MSQPGCSSCEELRRRVAELEALVRDLQERLGVNASNSSLPPSANPPAAPKPVTKMPSGKRRGAQPGHPPALRQRLPAARVNHAYVFAPLTCDRCQEPLPTMAGPDDPEPSWHQVAELPALAAEVTEYRGEYRTGPGCGKLNHAAIPQDIKAHSVGPRLAAFFSYLAGRHHVSHRGLEEIAQDVLEIPLSLGTVTHVQQQMSQALAAAHAQALAAVRQAAVKNVDETSWKLSGKLCWLWLAATGTVAAFVIHAGRGASGLAALLGTRITGLVCSDRWSVYGRLSPYCRQLCWAHLRRDFQKLVDRGGASVGVGRALQQVSEQVFAQWHLFRGGGITRATLQRRLDGPARQLERALRKGRRCADAKTATFCENLVELLPAVWRFVVSDGVEPTNNHAERLRRRGVLWRKHAFGSQSVAGCRFVERLLTVVQTRRLQTRSVLAYLHEALVAHRKGLPAPSLLETA
jgi:transposase